MKYGKISLLIDRFETVNLGDVVQDLACEYLYGQMGIGIDEIIEISYDQTYSYDGEYVVVPVYNAMLDGYFEPQHRFSPKIIPVFLGLMTDLPALPDDMADYLRGFEPIGCRDEYTLGVMRRHGLNSYLGSCLTLALPGRDRLAIGKAVFFTDIPAELKRYIPSELLGHAEFATQTIHVAECADREMRRRAIRKTTEAFYQKYQDEATLVVTSKLHSTLPCLAFGIPVVLAREEVWKTFSFVDKLLPLHTPETFANIDWQPKVRDISYVKDAVKSIFIRRMREAYERYAEMLTLSSYYENRESTVSKADYFARLDELSEVLRDNFAERQFDYIIWGAGVRGHIARCKISEEFAHSNFVCYADSIKASEEFEGQRVIAPDHLADHTDAFVIICTNSGEAQVQEFMKIQGRSERIDYWSTNRKEAVVR
jgi:hypothetical protein